MGLHLALEVGKSVILQRPGECIRLDLASVKCGKDGELYANLRLLSLNPDDHQLPVADLMRETFPSDALKASVSIRRTSSKSFSPTSENKSYADGHVDGSAAETNFNQETFSLGFRGESSMVDEGGAQFFEVEVSAGCDTKIDKAPLAERKELEKLGILPRYPGRRR